MTVKSDLVVEMLRAAGEPTRLRVLALLAREELSVMEIGQILGHSQPRVSRHLKLLTQAGLVERFPDGAWVFYRLCSAQTPRRFVDQTLSLIDPADAGLRADLTASSRSKSARATESAGSIRPKAWSTNRLGVSAEHRR